MVVVRLAFTQSNEPGRGIITEMSINVAHLVLVAFRYANDHVVDEGSDGSERCDVLSRAMVQFDVNNIFFRVRKGNREMTEVLGEFACQTASVSLSGLALRNAGCY